VSENILGDLVPRYESYDNTSVINPTAKEASGVVVEGLGIFDAARSLNYLMLQAYGW
jgi:hypothetical protein